MSLLFRFLFSDLRFGCMVFCICTSAGGFLCLQAQVTATDTILDYISVPVEVRTTSLSKINSTPVKLIDFDRKPAVFNDPARLIALQPGVAQSSDQANHLVVRGNNPNRNLWLINGLAIVNPNHTSNGGTARDRPTLSGGGVNALSPQLLYNSRFYASGLPAKYGNAPGGAFALELRPGAVDNRRLRALASFIGIDLTAENYIQPDNPYSWSYLATYRYSFTGLLADFGVDFGGEEIRFQDAGLHLHKWTRSGGAISLFGLYGNSSNVFRGPEAASEVMEEKDTRNIDFTSDLVILTGRWQQPFGDGHLMSLAAGYSEADPRRQEEFVGGPFLEEVNPLHQRLNARLDVDLNAGLSFGVAYLRDRLRYSSKASSTGDPTVRRTQFDRYSGYVSYERSWGKLSTSVGIDGGLFRGINGSSNAFIDPRLLFDYSLSNSSSLWLSAESITTSPIEAQRFTEFAGQAPTFENYRLSIGYGGEGGAGTKWSVTLFGQLTPDDYAIVLEDFLLGDRFLISQNNIQEIAAPSFFTSSITDTRRYGIEGAWSAQSAPESWRFNLNGSLFRAETQQLDNSWAQDRWSYGWTAQAGTGRDWAGTTKRGKDRTLGISLVMIARGGERRFPFVTTEFAGTSFTGEDLFAGFSDQLRAYFRPDLRLYREVKGKKVTTTLALDIQNVAGIENEAFREFDSVTDRVETRTQLGLIPVLSYRLVWN
ncbi:MAG: hypothetical protein AAGF87_02795 [Bacteroidota bacterium]